MKVFLNTEIASARHSVDVELDERSTQGRFGTAANSYLSVEGFCWTECGQ